MLVNLLKHIHLQELGILRVHDINLLKEAEVADIIYALAFQLDSRRMFARSARELGPKFGVHLLNYPQFPQPNNKE